MQFLDEVKIYLKSGDGGNGCVSFRREKFIDRGGPDGGNGGRGGSIVIECVNGLNTLVDYRYKQHFKAKNGVGGMGRNRNGEAGPDLILKVPLGTQVLADDKETIIADFIKVGQKEIILKGGDGGVGNAYYKSSINQAPTKFKPGKIGEEMWVWMQLKLISDAGLVGMPNAGKSTFLSKISSAKPKIADYPFTTLKPQLGVTYIDDYEFVIADIPGLIKGASHGVGLGDRFLKHIERCGVIIHLIDITSESVVENYQIIRDELSEYGLNEKKEIVVLNKIDALDNDHIQMKINELKGYINKDVYAISCLSSNGVNEVLRSMKDIIFESRDSLSKL